jgi:hypothetical protein
MPSGREAQRFAPGDAPAYMSSEKESKKGDLASWWRTFKKTSKREEEKGAARSEGGLAI